MKISQHVPSLGIGEEKLLEALRHTTDIDVGPVHVNGVLLESANSKNNVLAILESR